MLEGVRLVTDALNSGAACTLILYAPEQLQSTEAGQHLLTQLSSDNSALMATPQVIAAATETVHPQGVVALAHYPEVAPEKPGIVLIIDRVQDPGNVGTLLRSAEAVGVAAVLCVRGTVDLYSPKVVRAAMGAHFRIALEQDLIWASLADHLMLVDHTYAADADATMPYYAADWRQPSALIIGNETQGLGDEARTYATKLISIPMQGSADSLNAAVAGSIVLFEALRQCSLGRS